MVGNILRALLSLPHINLTIGFFLKKFFCFDNWLFIEEKASRYLSNFPLINSTK